jgi:alpha-1,2-mannosyltransferase
VNRDRCAAFVRDRLIFGKAAAALLWLAWLISIARTGFTRDVENKPIGADHLAFHSAAKLIDEGRGSLIYDYAFLAEYQPTLVDFQGRFLDAYRNPPFYALLYLPTSRLPYLASYAIWTAISLAMLWLGLHWLGVRKQWTAFVVSLSFYPVFAVVSFGQNSLLSFGFFCLVFRLMERRRLLFAGLAAGLLLYKPQLLLGLGLWWLLNSRQYWKCLLGLAIAGVCWGVVSFVFVANETRQFVEHLREIASYDAFMFWNMHNPRAFGTLIAGDDKAIGNVVGLLASVAGIACFVWFWRRHGDNLPLMFGASVFLTLWASPHTMIYEWSLALIPAVLLWDRVADKRDEWLVLFAVSWAAFFISTPIARFLFELTENGETHAGWAIQLSVPVIAWVAVRTMQILNSKQRAL